MSSYIKLKILAKRFKKTIPTNMALPLSDKVVNELDDGDVSMFFTILDSLGLQQNDRGHWERR